MAQGQKQSLKNQSGKERRAYPRYPVALKAQLIHTAKGTRAVIIKDYCIGGMYIELIDPTLLGEEPSSLSPKIGDTLNVVTNVQHGGVDKQLAFNTKVMRVEPEYIGVSFLNPDISAIQTLHKFAASRGIQGSDDEQDFGTTQTTFNGKSSAQVLTEAHQLVAKELLPLMADFHGNISEHFFEAAKETFDLAKQNALFESLGILEKNKNKITKAFTAIYESKIKNYSPQNVLLEEDNDEEKEISLESLSLVESDDLDNWLSISSIITNVDADHRDVLSEIERRASALYQSKINKKNNPFGPALFAQAFQESLDDIEIKHAVKLVCYTAFRDVYLAIAAKLYKNINQFFIDNDVLPKLKFKIEHSKGSSSAASAAQEEEQEFEEDLPEDNYGDASVPPMAGGHSGAAGNPNQSMPGRAGRQSASAGNPNHSVPGNTGGHATSAQNIAQGNAGTPPNSAGMSPVQGREFVNSMHQQPAVSGQTGSSGGAPGLMDVFSDLRGLQQNLDQVQAGVPSDQISSEPATPSLPGGGVAQHFSPTDLLDALSSEQLTGYDYSGQSDSNQLDLKEKIQSILAAKGGAENKVISAREGQVIDVASNVFSSLMSDFQVAESIRPWIKQLEVPVLKMAIMDTDVFTDTSHVVRKVINKISELEVLADSDDAEEQQAVKRAFDWLVKVINDDFDGTPKVFERIAQQLDILIKIQETAFEKNLKGVVDEFLKEDEATADEKVVIDTEDEWARRVSRLEEGDWILFEAFSETPIRLKVGWVARHKGKFVFVNVLGKKEKVLKSDELIELFKEGETIALDGAEEPAMDRAQYSMLQKLHKQLLFQSSHDQLTGLINRREFEVCLEKAIDDAKISNSKHALCYIDLDKFNVINNSCGYEGGDALIKEVADILKKHLSENSALSRFSGDEFGMLLCGHGTDDALEVIESILEEFNNYRFVWEDKRLSVALSAGLILIKGHGQNVSKLLQDAEASSGVAKEIGGHRVQVYHEGHARLNKHNAEVQWAAQIDKALDDDSLHLRCQRIMPLATDDSYHDHYEILLGMTDDLGEQSSLQEFIRAAENYKRMADIDRWVIKTAFKWIAEHRTQLDHVSSFSINLSGHSLNDLGLMEFVMKQMRNTNVPISKICFEITETLGIANLSDASDFIKRFKTTGCQFSLDDFGSGMSSYGYLKSLPVDYLKIDGVFVKEMATNPNDYAVVKSISEIGHFMGKKIIAEFVQDDETIQLLQDLGIDYAQGYGIERPRALDDILL
jgi:diguanylate cyclase (GGDEF)-like protein